jgi:hypothetical protein
LVAKGVKNDGLSIMAGRDNVIRFVAMLSLST